MVVSALARQFYLHLLACKALHSVHAVVLVSAAVLCTTGIVQGYSHRYNHITPLYQKMLPPHWEGKRLILGFSML